MGLMQSLLIQKHSLQDPHIMFDDVDNPLPTGATNICI